MIVRAHVHPPRYLNAFFCSVKEGPTAHSPGITVTSLPTVSQLWESFCLYLLISILDWMRRGLLSLPQIQWPFSLLAKWLHYLRQDWASKLSGNVSFLATRENKECFCLKDTPSDVMNLIFPPIKSYFFISTETTVWSSVFLTLTVCWVNVGCAGRKKSNFTFFVSKKCIVGKLGFFKRNVSLFPRRRHLYVHLNGFLKFQNTGRDTHAIIKPIYYGLIIIKPHTFQNNIKYITLLDYITTYFWQITDLIIYLYNIIGCCCWYFCKICDVVAKKTLEAKCATFTNIKCISG